MNFHVVSLGHRHDGRSRLLGFQCDNNAMWQITGFKLQGADTVRISFSVNAACNVFGCYQGTDATDNYDLYASVSAGSKYLRYGNGTYLSYFSPSDLGQRFDVVYTPTGSSGMPQDSTWTPKTFTSANDLLIGSTTTGGTSSKLKGNLYGDIITDEAAQIQGGVGTAGSANIGDRYAMFEAIHGSAPRMIERGMGAYANPASIIKAAAMLLRHICRTDAAEKLEKAMADCTLEVKSDGTAATGAQYAEALIEML